MNDDGAGRKPPGGDRGAGTGPATPGEALAEAARHARASMAEAALAVRALLDALVLAAGGSPAAGSGGLAELRALLEAAARTLAPDGGRDAELLTALFEAIEVEIRRWEERAADDPEARAVLRAWIGLRELLFELGARPGRSGGRTGGRSRRRVRRVPVED